MKAKKKIVVCFGTRPEAIKMAPVVLELKKREDLQCFVCSTGQHKEMLSQVLEIFDIAADFSLDIMTPNQTLPDLTSSLISKLAGTLSLIKPDCLLVHGDTATAFSAALAGFYLKCDVGHVEAGLRTGNRYAPWPEEIYRKMIGNIAALHFAPTKRAHSNLIHEGVSADTIFTTGNTVVDALRLASDKIKYSSACLEASSRPFARIDFSKKILLITAHRRESFDGGLECIFEAVAELSQRNDVEIVYPVHLNPQVQKRASEYLTGRSNIHLIPPVNYLQMVYILSKAYLILSDSGGIQEEAPTFGCPVLVLRETTERPEAIEAGIAQLVGYSAQRIVAHSHKILDDKALRESFHLLDNPFGDGYAASRIVSLL